MHVQDYKFLTFANIPPPAPPPWVEQHTLLQQAVDIYLQQQSQSMSDQQHQQLKSAAADLSLEWYISMMSRLHLNCFRSALLLHMHGCQLGDLRAGPLWSSELCKHPEETAISQVPSHACASWVAHAVLHSASELAGSL